MLTVESLMNRMHPQLQRKWRREPSASHGTEQPGAEGSPKALDDPEYCPSTYDESEDGSDSLLVTKPGHVASAADPGLC